MGIRAPLAGLIGLWRSVTPLGRGVVTLGVTALALARLAGLVELSVVAATCGLLVVLSLPFVIVPTRVTARLTLLPQRTTVGTPVAGTLELVNRLPLPVGRPIVLVRSGTADRWLRLSTLPGRGTRTERFSVPAPHRGVITVGPVVYRRTDPVGLFSREIGWAPAQELLVRPVMIDLHAMPIGQVRDLDGVPSDQVSMSDLAFHALREYVRGDDLRHVHWRSSARAGQLVVRQYHDTRRTHATLLVDSRRDAFTERSDFELALSVAASLVLRAARDGHELTLVCGEQVVSSSDASYVLDAFCRSDFGSQELGPQVERSILAAHDTSLFFLVTGTERDVAQVQGALRHLPAEVWAGVLRTGQRSALGLTEYAGRPMLTLTDLAQLPVAIAGVAR
jgi:hypothetical protein